MVEQCVPLGFVLDFFFFCMLSELNVFCKKVSNEWKRPSIVSSIQRAVLFVMQESSTLSSPTFETLLHHYTL